MKKQIAVMIALFAVVAAGCKKDKDNPLEGGENGKTKYISKITTTEDDVQTVYVANYDSQNRLLTTVKRRLSPTVPTETLLNTNSKVTKIKTYLKSLIMEQMFL
jgi:hypothetical protein